jgi:hypothetical protein
VNILVSAYACELGLGSEPGAGRTFARAAALHHDVWLLTRSHLAPVIEPAPERRQLSGKTAAHQSALVVAQNNDLAKAFGGRRPAVIAPNVAMSGATPQR